MNTQKINDMLEDAQGCLAHSKEAVMNGKSDHHNVRLYTELVKSLTSLKELTEWRIKNNC